MINLRGVGVALITPFTAAGAVDFVALERLINRVSEGGVDYLVVMGTTGEAATLSAQERAEVLQFVLGHNRAKLPVVLGVGGNDTAEVCRAIREMDLRGVSALLSVVPYYNKPTQAGIYAHFEAVAAASVLPVILYNVPGRTGVNMTAETTVRLAKNFRGKFIGVKEASGDLGQVAYILRDAPKGFLVISGDDNLTLATIAMGGAGVISVSANCFSSAFCKMVHAAMAGNFTEAARLNLSLVGVTDMLFAEGNPAGAKAALAVQGLVGNYLRLPLVAVSDGLYKRIGEQIVKFKLS